MGLLDKIFKLTSITNERICIAELLSYNDAVTLIHDATKICWDKPPAKTYKEKKEFIRKRVATGHESILEHGNIAMLLIIDKKYLEDYASLSFRYLNTRIANGYEDGEVVEYYILIGGSIRGYKHLFRNLTDRNNKCAQMIAKVLYQISPREFWIDLIDDYVLKDRFTTIMTAHEFEEGREPIEDEEDYSELHPVDSGSELVEICNMDNITDIENICDDFGFGIDDYLDMATITIKFNNMSRIITQQLTRHRNGTTQASGRYIDMSDKVRFNSPDTFKDKYKGKTYNITIGGKAFNSLTLQELGDMLTPIYGQLIDQGLDREDARGYLPQNSQCGPVYMTFTYRSLLKFLELRTAKSAQAEIRMYANIIYNALHEILEDKLHTTDLYCYLEPIYKSAELANEATEVLETTEEIIEEDNKDD